MTEFAYIAVEPCGCVTGAVVDAPGRPREVAKDVAAFVRQGSAVERVPVESARERLTLVWPCEHEKGKRNAAKAKRNAASDAASPQQGLGIEA
jgi:hypothetical protein